MPVNHPDVEEFISIKSDLTKITNANISVRVDDAFMKAVQNNEPYKLEFFRAESGEAILKVVNAKEVFHKLCEMNWNYAEPGILFWDAITEHNLLQYDDNFEYAGVNPCAEEPLPAGGSCLLGAINLAAFVERPFTQDAKFDFVAFKHAVADAVYALNEVLDEGLPLHPLEEQRNSVRDWRQIGLGIMGLADCLIKLGLTYGSSEANHMCEVIARVLFGTSVCASESIAKDCGSYPMCDIDAINASDMMKSCELEIGGIHNSQLLTVAPTGSISTMIGVSGGIEPIFANSYTRKTQSLHGEDVYYKVYTPIVEHYMKAHDIKEESDLPPEFVVASDIDPMSRIECQAAWQKWIDASISSTINLPNEATVEDVEKIYMHAWECGLKGVTVYRAGCAREGVLVTEEMKEKTNDNADACNCVSDLPRGYIVDTSDDLIGYKRKLTTGCGTMHMEVYFDELSGEPQETFINIGSGGGCERNYQFISRLISLALRGGVPIEDIIDQANSIRPCNAYVSRTKSKHDTSKGTSCPSAIGNALKDLYSKISDRCFDCELLEAMPEPKKTNYIVSNNKSICPECGSKLQQEGGCVICKNCAWTKCD
jgi:ribonucleoside-diphosphate reductase alpha chain